MIQIYNFKGCFENSRISMARSSEKEEKGWQETLIQIISYVFNILLIKDNLLHTYLKKKRKKSK